MFSWSRTRPAIRFFTGTEIVVAVIRPTVTYKKQDAGKVVAWSLCISHLAVHEARRRTVNHRTVPVAHKPGSGLYGPAKTMDLEAHAIDQIIASVILRHQWKVGQSQCTMEGRVSCRDPAITAR